MDKEQKAMFSDMGKQAAYLYNGAFEVFQNSKQAEKIVFLFTGADCKEGITQYFKEEGDL